MLSDDGLARLQVVVRQDDDVVENGLRHPWEFGNGRRAVRVEAVGGGRDADGREVVRAVVAALDLGYFRAAGEGLGGPDGVHRRLGARAGESDEIDRRQACAEHLREPHLGLGGGAEGYALRRLLLDRPRDVRVGMAHDQARRVEHEVQVAVAVDVVHVVALAAVYEERVRREVGRAPGAAPRQEPLGLCLECAGPRGGLGVAARLGRRRSGHLTAPIT